MRAPHTRHHIAGSSSEDMSPGAGDLQSCPWPVPLAACGPHNCNPGHQLEQLCLVSFPWGRGIFLL